MPNNELSISELNQEFPELNIIEKIGSGGQKQAFLCEFKNQKAALKLIQIENDPFSSESQKKRIEREIMAMKTVTSPYLVKLYEMGSKKILNKPYIFYIEEYIYGTPLDKYIENSSITQQQTVQIAVCMLSAISSLWRKKIVHRDIKPPNIIYDNKNAVLLDLGIARFVDKSSVTWTFLPFGPGTPIFCSSEVLTNKKYIQSFRSDLFSLGITLVVCHTGIHPFYLPPISITDNIIQGKHCNLNEIISNEKLAEILTLMIEKEPYLRPNDISELKREFKEVLE